MTINRRNFLQKTAISSLALLSPWPVTAISKQQERKFTLQLDGGSIGLQAGQEELIQLASQYGFESVSAIPQYLASLSPGEIEELSGDIKEKKLVWGSANLPVDFRKDQDTFRQGLADLPNMAQALQRAGVSRMGTWIMSNHAELTYLQNFRQHAVRLREIAGMLQDYGIRLGLEYVGPKTIWTANRFPFIYTMAETQELIAAIGLPNLGLVLDSFHWYTAGEDVDDIRSLDNKDVVACDLNDARANIKREEQVDGRRELPLATGVIDVKAFLEALLAIGYDGPVRAEPFNQELNQLEDEAAVQKTAVAMKKAFSLVS